MTSPSTLIYILLSPTFGMHQYTADLANRAGELGSGGAEENKSPIRNPQSAIHLVTTSTYPAHRYGPGVCIHTPVTATGTGFGLEGLDILAFRRVLATLDAILAGRGSGGAEGQGGGGEFFSPPGSPIRQSPVASPRSPFAVHFTGVHLWNPLLLMALRRRGVRTIHTLHDLDPHHGVRFGSLIRLWNRLIIHQADHILVHGQVYRERLLAWGVPARRITCTPLLHGFWGARERGSMGAGENRSPLVLFFGRVEAYKGIHVLLDAWQGFLKIRGNSCNPWQKDARLIIAGLVAADVNLPSLPASVELRNRRITDEEGIDLFRQAALVVLPYVDATQSALVATAYRFAKPVIVTRSGALPETVIEGETGWVVPPNDVDHLASALHHALAHPDRLQRMGLAGRRWYERQRLLERHTLHDMYSQLSAQRS